MGGLMDKEFLKRIAEVWLQNTIESWFYEYGSWDAVVEDNDLTEEDVEWIQNNIKFNFEAEIVNEDNC